MNREHLISNIEEESGFWDILIIGGGATGLGAALEAASRGYKTLLLEQHDFSKGTSSRSTKLVHGGVRYLQQGNISLVLEALHERGLLMQNAPHLVHNQPFIVPNYDWWDGPFYGIGLKVYDLLAGKLGLGPSKILSKEETINRIQNIEPNGLRGGVVYYDGQFDDSRLAINLAQTIVDEGGTPLNYFKVLSLLKRNGMVGGVIAIDTETEKEYEIHARVVVNATGIFTDSILSMDDPKHQNIIALSQGVHLILDKEFLPGEAAIMVPQTDDGRVLFAVPWHDHVVVGTTDTEIQSASLEPKPLDEEIEFIMKHAKKYMHRDPDIKDVKSAFAGIRPLVKPVENKNTAAISRDHFLVVSNSGLVTITGGKWTTYRKMGEDTINQAAMIAGLESQPSKTQNLRIHGWLKNIDKSDPLYVYGSNAETIKRLRQEQKGFDQVLTDSFTYTKAEILWHIRSEMARNIEDVLARRTRALLLDAEKSRDLAPVVAKIMAKELNKNTEWEEDQVKQYFDLSQNYILNERGL